MTTLNGDEPDLELGASGEHVVQLQDRLRGMGLLDKFPDGSYDDQTETAVRQLQNTLGQSGDGRVSQETWQALDQRMLDQGLYYNPYAGPGQQHWDVAARGGDGQHPVPHEAAHVQQQHADSGQHVEPYWDGQQWLQWDAAAGQWLPMQDANQGEAAAHGAAETTGTTGASAGAAARATGHDGAPVITIESPSLQALGGGEVRCHYTAHNLGAADAAADSVVMYIHAVDGAGTQLAEQRHTLAQPLAAGAAEPRYLTLPVGGQACTVNLYSNLRADGGFDDSASLTFAGSGGQHPAAPHAPSAQAASGDGPLHPGDSVVVGDKRYVVLDAEVRTGGTLAWINNNPGNIVAGSAATSWGAYAGKSNHRFAIFPTYELGYEAIKHNLRSSGYQHLTLGQAITRWAPPEDNNDTEAYIASVSKQTGIARDKVMGSLSDDELDHMAQAIKHVEGFTEGKTFSKDDTALPQEVRSRLH